MNTICYRIITRDMKIFLMVFAIIVILAVYSSASAYISGNAGDISRNELVTVTLLIIVSFCALVAIFNNCRLYLKENELCAYYGMPCNTVRIKWSDIVKIESKNYRLSFTYRKVVLYTIEDKMGNIIKIPGSVKNIQEIMQVIESRTPENIWQRKSKNSIFPI